MQNRCKTINLLLVVALVNACGGRRSAGDDDDALTQDSDDNETAESDDDTSDGESGGEESACEADLETDPANCGACGRVCTGPLDSGSCVNGACGPRFGSCASPEVQATNCEEACKLEGLAGCAAEQCLGATVVAWDNPDIYACPSALELGLRLETLSCTDPLPFGPETSALRCCCTP